MAKLVAIVRGIVLVIPIALASSAWAAYWPQFRCDAARSASTVEPLPETLNLLWQRDLLPPRPAFPAEVRLLYDETYQPVAAEGLLFVPSMVTHTVTAYDGQTGRVVWRFFADAPVRFAPAYYKGRLFVCSDDGCLYCLEAQTGNLLWKLRGTPPGKHDRKILGHGQLISLWPARGGPVVKDDIVYFAAGIWSQYGVAIYAVDTTTGKVLWANTDSNRIPRANMDHGVAHYAGLSPQGYLAIVDERLVVPCGPQLPALLDIKTGKLGTYTMGWGGRNGLPKGTWFVAGWDRYLSHGGDLYDIRRPNEEQFGNGQSGFKPMLYIGGYTRLKVDPTNAKDLGRFIQPVFHDGLMFETNGKQLIAYDLHNVVIRERTKEQLADSRPGDPCPDRWYGQFNVLWQYPTKLRLLAKAGDCLLLGGKGLIQAVRIPSDNNEKLEVVWQCSLEGTVHTAFVAEKRLVVVTREGSIYVFGSGAKTQTKHYAAPKLPESPVAGPLPQAVVKKALGDGGYAVVLGIEDGNTVVQLASQPNCYVVAIDADNSRVQQLRRRLFEMGLYGTRAVALTGDPVKMPLPPLFASLVVSENWERVANAPDPDVILAVARLLHPYGGMAFAAADVVSPDELQPVLTTIGENVRLGNLRLQRSSDGVLLIREGSLPGAGSWTHELADAANTGASNDQFAQPPFDLLWFDGPPRWLKPVGATLVRIDGGKMFIKASKLWAFDVFTGRKLWERPLPFPHNSQAQFVVHADHLYVTAGKTCLVYSARDGKLVKQIQLPDYCSGPWLQLHIRKNQLVASSGKELVCVDADSGQVRWHFTCSCGSLSIALSNDKVFCAELPDPKRGRKLTDVKTRAFDLATGQLLWEIQGGWPLRYNSKHDAVVTDVAVLDAKTGKQIISIAQLTRPNEKRQQAYSPLFVLADLMLIGQAELFVPCDFLTGKPLDKPFAWMRRGCTIPRASAALVTTRYRGNAACIHLPTKQIITFWNVRAACSNNLFPADGLINMPSLTGGCTCNYLPVSQAYAPSWLFNLP